MASGDDSPVPEVPETEGETEELDLGESGGLDGSLEDCCLEDCNQRLELCCDICKEKLKEPKVLPCLHSFCEACLVKKVEEVTAPVDGEPTKPFVCPVQNCEHELVVPGGKVSNMLTDFVAIDMLKPKAEKQAIICTSCKAQEEAIARCQDCPNFLCSNCFTAHQFMRCFEDHRVRSFKEILESGGTLVFSKPVLCPKHAKENLVSFCKLCEVAACQKCITEDHLQPEHVVVAIAEAEGQVVEELQKLVEKGKNVLDMSHDEHQKVEQYLGELSMQTDNAKGLITEAIISCKALLDKIKDTLFEELDEKNNKVELQLMDTFHLLDVHETRLEAACSFAERVLKHECPTYSAIFSRMIRNQIFALLTKPPKTSFKFNIEFKHDAQAFEGVVRQTFGWWASEEPKAKHVAGLPLSSAHSSFDSDTNFSQLAAASMMSPEEMMVAQVTDSDYHHHHHMPPMSTMSTLGMNGSNLENLAGMTNVQTVASSMASGQPILAHLESSISRSSVSPAMSDSGISVDNASTNSNNSATMIQNAAAMAKLSAVGLGSQAILGSSMGPMSRGSPSSLPSPGSRTITPMSHSHATASDDTIRSILAMSPTSHVSASSVSPVQGNLDQLASLLHTQPPPSMPGISSLPFSTFSSMDGSSASGANGGQMASGIISPISSNGSGGGGTSLPYPPVRRTNRMSAMQIRCKFGQLGPGKSQFNSPHGFCLGLDQDIVVADTNNHRIQIFEKNGDFKSQFGVPGREEGQLWYPRKVAVMKPSGKFVVCDRGNERSRMQIFNRSGHFLKKIAIRYIDIVAGLAITYMGNIVAVDSVSPTVFVISEGGDLLKWFDCSDYMREPSDIAVSNKEYFVCDFKGHCVVVFNEDGEFMRRIGCENITNYPNGIDISDAGDVLIGDSHGNRFHVAVFQRDGSLIGEFQCPYVKVSRCCGLKITLEGYIVTLAKNNHHVLVLNTLYIT